MTSTNEQVKVHLSDQVTEAGFAAYRGKTDGDRADRVRAAMDAAVSAERTRIAEWLLELSEDTAGITSLTLKEAASALKRSWAEPLK
jgi:hypothetical protein